MIDSSGSVISKLYCIETICYLNLTIIFFLCFRQSFRSNWMMSMSRSLSCQYCRNCQETNDISSTYTLKSFRMLKWHVKTTQRSTTWLKKTGKSSMIYLVILNTRYNFWLQRSVQCPLLNNQPDFWLVEAVKPWIYYYRFPSLIPTNQIRWIRSEMKQKKLKVMNSHKQKFKTCKTEPIMICIVQW